MRGVVVRPQTTGDFATSHFGAWGLNLQFPKPSAAIAAIQAMQDSMSSRTLVGVCLLRARSNLCPSIWGWDAKARRLT